MPSSDSDARHSVSDSEDGARLHMGEVAAASEWGSVSDGPSKHDDVGPSVLTPESRPEWLTHYARRYKDLHSIPTGWMSYN